MVCTEGRRSCGTGTRSTMSAQEGVDTGNPDALDTEDSSSTDNGIDTGADTEKDSGTEIAGCSGIGHRRPCESRTGAGLERKPTGEVYLTFRSQSLRDAFLQKSSFVTRRSGRQHVPNTAEQSLIFLTVYDAPYELPDLAIIHRLSPYCEVAWHRRGTYRSVKEGSVFNGLRHYRVRVHHAIPSFLRFGKFLIRLYHDGQQPTCRKCNRLDHKAAECHNIICFNCDGWRKGGSCSLQSRYGGPKTVASPASVA